MCLFRIGCGLLLLSASLGAQSYNELSDEQIQAVVNSFPKTQQEIDLYLAKQLEEATKRVEMIAGNTKPEMIMRTWDEVGKCYFTPLALLYGMPLIFSSQEMLEKGQQAFMALNMSLAHLVHDEKAIESIVASLESSLKTKRLSASENYYFKAFIEGDLSAFSEKLQKRIQKVKAQVSRLKSVPYTYVKTKSFVELPKDGFLRVMSWNLCFLPDPLPLMFGGMLPWKLRIHKAAQFIKDSNADVICLQEVFEEEPALALKELLKDDYHYFYLNIAPKNFGFNPALLNINSGLFIASKYPISHPHWCKYTDTCIETAQRGFFAFEVENRLKKVCIVTTHLESSIVPGMAESIREKQLKQMLHHLDEKFKEHKTVPPVIVCGDLNIYWGANEPSDEVIKTFFQDPHNEYRKEVTLDNCTYCDFTGYWWPEYGANAASGKFRPKPDVLDYTLPLKSVPSGKMVDPISIKSTAILRAHAVNKPEQALSDHHAVLTTFAW